MNAAERFMELTGHPHDFILQAPGRTELGGNHTDHQHGRVLAAPVDLAATGMVRKNGLQEVRVFAEGFEPFTVSLSDTDIHPEEFGMTSALVRGICADFMDCDLPGFDLLITSDIPMGSGLSSSAAIEILLGRICCRLTGVQRSGRELAILGQKVENQYFGKPCGLMDQMACAADGIVAIDFRDPKNPEVEEMQFSFQDAGYVLCIINCGAGHENLTANYADITVELKDICSQFGRGVLREIPEEQFYGEIVQLRQACGDRAVLRAIHVYNDNRRVEQQIAALKAGDMDSYLQLVRESGRSSWELLQNVIPEGASRHQEMAVALAAAEKCLAGKGAVRVHGGGFAGTLQAYVPVDQAESFMAQMNALMGQDCCTIVHV